MKYQADKDHRNVNIKLSLRKTNSLPIHNSFNKIIANKTALKIDCKSLSVNRTIIFNN